MDHTVCKYQDKIIKMCTDIEWIRKDIEDTNGTFKQHISESDCFRKQVGRNTAWRVAFQWLLIIIIGIILKLLVA